LLSGLTFVRCGLSRTILSGMKRCDSQQGYSKTVIHVCSCASSNGHYNYYKVVL